MTRIEADAAKDGAGAPRVRLRIEVDDERRPDRTGHERVVTLTVAEAMAARDALNRALNDLGLPDTD